MVVDHPLHWVKACKWLSHLLVELVSRPEDRMHLSTVSSVRCVLLLLVTRHPSAAQVHFLTAARASTDALAAIIAVCVRSMRTLKSLRDSTRALNAY